MIDLHVEPLDAPCDREAIRIKINELIEKHNLLFEQMLMRDEVFKHHKHFTSVYGADTSGPIQGE